METRLKDEVVLVFEISIIICFLTLLVPVFLCPTYAHREYCMSLPICGIVCLHELHVCGMLALKAVM
jgi:hypothetical protein